MKLYTTAEAAEKLGCSPRTISRIAAKIGIEKIANVLILTAADLKQVATHVHDGPGNPTIAAESAKGVAARKRKKKKTRKPGRKLKS